MMKYVKPDVFVTKFSANAFCESCAVTSYNKPVKVQCIISQSEYVYSDGVNGCTYTGKSIVSFGGGYFKDRMDVIDAFSDDFMVTADEYSTTKDKNHSYALAAGDYLVWYGNGNYHVGPVGPAESESIKNHS